MKLHGTNQVVCFIKFLRSEVGIEVKHHEKLASWKKARELGVCAPFKLLERDKFEEFLDKERETV